MNKTEINHRFRSIPYILIHVLCSLIQLACALTIFGLQITLTITKTCAFRIGVGFWSFPFLLSTPISIWIFLWKQNFISCLITFLIHICSTLFATSIIIVSFIALIEQIKFPCSSSNNYFLSINIFLIVISIVFKILIYVEILTFYMFQHEKNRLSILLEKDFHENDHQMMLNDINTKFRSTITKIQHYTDDLNV